MWEGRDDFDDCGTDTGSAADGGGSAKEGDGIVEEEPPSFSRVDLAAAPSDIAVDFPGFPGLEASVSCTLAAGLP